MSKTHNPSRISEFKENGKVLILTKNKTNESHAKKIKETCTFWKVENAFAKKLFIFSKEQEPTSRNYVCLASPLTKIIF